MIWLLFSVFLPYWLSPNRRSSRATMASGVSWTSFSTTAYYLFTPSYTADFSADMDAFCHRLNDAAGQKEHKHILEIGSSNGSLLKRLQDAGWNVLGIEPSAPLVKDAQRQGGDTEAIRSSDKESFSSCIYCAALSSGPQSRL